MANLTGLFRRGGSYYIRIVLPEGHPLRKKYRSGKFIQTLGDWHYGASAEVSNGVGRPAMGPESLPVGRVTGTIALLAVSTSRRAPQGRGVLPPTRH